MGRVLRLPYTQKNISEVLNLSYVITSSADFHQTLEKVVAGLNSAGFSSRDYRAQDVDVPIMAAPIPEPEQLPIVPPSTDEPDLPEVDGVGLKARFEAAAQEAEQSVQDGAAQSDPMLTQALQQNRTYEDEINSTDNTALSQVPSEVRDKMNQFRMNEEFADEALYDQFNGHPMLLRLACSYINRQYNDPDKRPITVTADNLKRLQDDIDAELAYYFRHIVSEIQKFYPEEYEMFELLASGQTSDFVELSAITEYTKHLYSYGLVGRESINRDFTISSSLSSCWRRLAIRSLTLSRTAAILRCSSRGGRIIDKLLSCFK